MTGSSCLSFFDRSRRFTLTRSGGVRFDVGRLLDAARPLNRRESVLDRAFSKSNHHGLSHGGLTRSVLAPVGEATRMQEIDGNTHVSSCRHFLLRSRHRHDLPAAPLGLHGRCRSSRTLPGVFPSFPRQSPGGSYIAPHGFGDLAPSSDRNVKMNRTRRFVCVNENDAPFDCGGSLLPVIPGFRSLYLKR